MTRRGCGMSIVIEQRDATQGPPIDGLLNGAMMMWTDPPYGTGKHQRQQTNRYHDQIDVRYVLLAISQWADVLHPDGTIAVCCDYRLSARLVNALNETGWEYRGEIIWTFGLGRPRTSWWPVRHNTIHTFTRPGRGHFDSTAVPTERRLAPKPGYPDTKPAGSVWDYTMSNTHPDRVGYPNQKPVELIEPFVLAHTRPGDLVIDPFCGSGSTGAAAHKHGRHFYGSDNNPAAIKLAKQRLVVAA